MEETPKEPEKVEKVCGNCTKFKKFYFGKGKPLRGYCNLRETDVKNNFTCTYHEEVH